MRRSLTSLLVLASAAMLTVGMAGTASAAEAVAASPCVAVAEPPHLKVGGARRYSTGSVNSTSAAYGLSVTVCIEEQYAVDAPWWSRGCTTVKDLYEARSSIEATASTSVPVYATYLRATVTGVNSRGDRSTFTTPPVFWFNCACYIG
jgi:hypothetical protein